MTPAMKASTAEQVQVEQRLFQYAGCTGYVLRWFITSDAVPVPYRSEKEALEVAARQCERRGTP